MAWSHCFHPILSLAIFLNPPENSAGQHSRQFFPVGIKNSEARCSSSFFWEFQLFHFVGFPQNQMFGFQFPRKLNGATLTPNFPAGKKNSEARCSPSFSGNLHFSILLVFFKTKCLVSNLLENSTGQNPRQIFPA